MKDNADLAKANADLTKERDELKARPPVQMIPPSPAPPSPSILPQGAP
jgi:hypothetical protein